MLNFRFEFRQSRPPFRARIPVTSAPPELPSTMSSFKVIVVALLIECLRHLAILRGHPVVYQVGLVEFLYLDFGRMGRRWLKKSADDVFACKRVCTSKRMLKKVGACSKEPIPDTCVTVCGVSELNACADACARTVCVNQHQVPNWNDVCLQR
ncbi:UNVERIFIED_CONTAM: hypothetical protein Scaly_1053900 [Sesamum calycinum]|uniref:Uncharacterized protein n=1 Tax=Sesamum calycinum TaxID=2727403 RepID=A0AAW2QLG0_9LAMI